jgi:hypothetical protein
MHIEKSWTPWLESIHQGTNLEKSADKPDTSPSYPSLSSPYFLSTTRQHFAFGVELQSSCVVVFVSELFHSFHSVFRLVLHRLLHGKLSQPMLERYQQTHGSWRRVGPWWIWPYQGFSRPGTAFGWVTTLWVLMMVPVIHAKLKWFTYVCRPFDPCAFL